MVYWDGTLMLADVNQPKYWWTDHLKNLFATIWQQKKVELAILRLLASRKSRIFYLQVETVEKVDSGRAALVVSEYEVPKVWFPKSVKFFVKHPVQPWTWGLIGLQGLIVCESDVAGLI